MVGEPVCARCADDDEINAWVTSAASAATLTSRSFERRGRTRLRSAPSRNVPSEALSTVPLCSVSSSALSVRPSSHSHAPGATHAPPSAQGPPARERDFLLAYADRGRLGWSTRGG